MRIVFYSHDTCGLGHIQRTLSIARQVIRQAPDASVMLITGSLYAHSLSMPQTMDYLKLPSVVKRQDGKYIPHLASMSMNDLVGMRDDMILGAVQGFNPDVFVVDKAPSGVHGELLRTLDFLKTNRPHTRIVLGMRDIEDDAHSTQAAWRKKGIYPLLENVYDAILFYGLRAIHDPVREYALSAKVTAKISEVGYVGKFESTTPAAALRARLGMRTQRLVLATAGGGSDGFDMLHAYVRMLRDAVERASLRFDTLMVTGPFLPEAQRKILHSFEGPGLNLKVIDATPEMFSWINAADAVVTMGGYNTVVEMLSLGKPGIIVPRVLPRIEQLIRARWLHDHGVLRMLHPDALSSSTLSAELAGILSNTRPLVTAESAGLTLQGAANAGSEILRMARASAAAREPLTPQLKPKESGKRIAKAPHTPPVAPQPDAPRVMFR